MNAKTDTPIWIQGKTIYSYNLILIKQLPVNLFTPPVSIFHDPLSANQHPSSST